jgi:hypothetical protein
MIEPHHLENPGILGGYWTVESCDFWLVVKSLMMIEPEKTIATYHGAISFETEISGQSPDFLILHSLRSPGEPSSHLPRDQRVGKGDHDSAWHDHR